MMTGLEILAGRAGGAMFSVDAGTPASVFDRVLLETRAYYVLGVEPADEDRDGKSHYIRVKTTARHADVRSRVQVVHPRRRNMQPVRPATRSAPRQLASRTSIRITLRILKTPNNLRRYGPV